MTDRQPCTACGNLILADTAAKTGGLCLPCQGGYRTQIESGKARREEERKQRESPASLHWARLVRRAHDPAAGLATLSPDERIYYAVCILSGDVYNGGFHQFFGDSAGELYDDALAGLSAMQAGASADIVRRAKTLLFGEATVPTDWQARRDLLARVESIGLDTPLGRELDALEDAFYADPDVLDAKCERFAIEHGFYPAHP